MLALMVLLAVYQVMDWGHRSFVGNTEDVNARSSGRAIIDLMAGDIRVAGYTPLGTSFAAVAAGTTTRIRLLSDRDGDGVVGTATESEENLTWWFAAVGGGDYELRRGVDLNGDLDFVDTGESVEVASANIVQVDANRDGTLDPFLTYDVAAPLTERVRIAFGVRNQTRTVAKRGYEIVTFQTDVALRNRVLQQ